MFFLYKIPFNYSNEMYKSSIDQNVICGSKKGILSVIDSQNFLILKESLYSVKLSLEN